MFQIAVFCEKCKYFAKPEEKIETVNKQELKLLLNKLFIEYTFNKINWAERPTRLNLVGDILP